MITREAEGHLRMRTKEFFGQTTRTCFTAYRQRSSRSSNSRVLFKYYSHEANSAHKPHEDNVSHTALWVVSRKRELWGVRAHLPGVRELLVELLPAVRRARRPNRELVRVFHVPLLLQSEPRAVQNLACGTVSDAGRSESILLDFGLRSIGFNEKARKY